MLSSRVSIQWPPEPAGDKTNTMVLVSNESHFVDIRIFSHQYPIIDENPTSEFDQIFEWCMTGDEIEQKPDGAEDYKISFTHELDSQSILQSIKQNKPIEECQADPDVGSFWKIDGSLDRKETGSMLNGETGRVQDYVEIWRSLDAIKHTPENEVRQGQDKVKSYVLRTNSDRAEGQLIRSGNWVQGLLWDKTNPKVPMNVVRAYYDVKVQKWVYLIKYGRTKFPVEFAGTQGDAVAVDGAQWTCIESDFSK